MFPSECVLERRVRCHGDENLAATDLPLFILECEDRKADGYAGDELERCDQMLRRMKIGVRLADKPPAVSYLVILGRLDFDAEIEAVNKNVIVVSVDFEGELPFSYLIYDAVASSLRMIPSPEDQDPSWIYTFTSSVSLVRPCHGRDYSLVHMGRLVGEVDSLYLWRPSSSSPPWSEKKKSTFPDLIDWSLNDINTQFSFNGHAYWVDLRCGVSYCSSDALFDDNISLVKFGGFIPLPVKVGGHHHRIAEPVAYRTMGVVRDSYIRFVSIDGFQDYVKLKKRTVTVWKLLDHDEGWEEEYKFSLETLWGFEGFDVPKDLTPMYPLLSTKETDIVYLVLGEYYENPFKRKFLPSVPRHLLAIDMQNKIVITSVPLEPQDWFLRLVSCGFSRQLRKALVGPCDDEGLLIRMKKRRGDGGNVAETHIPMKMKKPRLEKLICC
ncbi:unnamed protein product [Alopecurus aequalis]